MKKRFSDFSLLMLLFSLLSFGLPSCNGDDRDASIQIAISTKTAANSNFANVSAMVVDGVVTLMGQCKDEASRTDAERVINKVDGVKKVINNIMVTPEVVITPDAPLRTAAKKVISNYSGVQADVTNGVITLRGVLKQKKLPQLMMELNALQPKRIENQLAVK